MKVVIEATSVYNEQIFDAYPFLKEDKWKPEIQWGEDTPDMLKKL